MDDYVLEGVKEAIQENTPVVEPPSTTEEPVTEPTEEPAAEGETGDELPEEIAAPEEPQIEQTIPYERFREVNEAKIRAEEQARIYQEQLQRVNPPVEPELEPDEDYSLTEDELEYADEPTKKVYLYNQKLEAKLNQFEQVINQIAPTVQQQAAQAQAQAQFEAAAATIERLTGVQPDKTALMAKAEEIADQAIKSKQSMTIEQAVFKAYETIRSAPAVPPKPTVKPANQATKEAVQRPGGVSVPTGARQVVEGNMDIADAVRSALNEIPKPH